MPIGQYNNNNWTPNNNWSGGWSQNQLNQQFSNNTQQQSIDNILRVIGPESAKAYPLSANSNVVLFDAKNPIFYWKVTDDSGYSYPLRAFKFEEITNLESQSQTIEEIDISNFATKEDLTALKENVSEIKEILEGLVN